MDERLSHFYGSDNFEALDYRLVRDGVSDRHRGHARPEELGTELPALRPRAAEHDFQGGTVFKRRRAAQVTRSEPLRRRSGQSDLRDRRRIRCSRTEFYQPIGYTSNWFVVPRLLVERQSLDIFEGDRRLRPYRVDDREARVPTSAANSAAGANCAQASSRGNGTSPCSDRRPDDPACRHARTSIAASSWHAVQRGTCWTTYFPRHGDLFTLQWNGPAREPRRRRECRPHLPVDWTHARS
jgi:hypothetical protein